MRATIKLLFIFLFFYSCNNNAALMSPLNANEDKGIKEILSFYGGRCEYGRENTVSIGKPNAMNFWIKLSQSSDVDSLADMAELPGSNIPYLFYRNLTEKERKYDNIQSEVIFGDGGSVKYTYTQQQLKIVETKLQLVDKIVAILKSKNIEALKTYLKPDTALFDFNAEKAIEDIKKVEGELGTIKEFTLYGFKFYKSTDGRDIFKIAGIINRDSKSSYFSAYFDPNPAKEEIFALNYKL